VTGDSDIENEKNGDLVLVLLQRSKFMQIVINYIWFPAHKERAKLAHSMRGIVSLILDAWTSFSLYCEQGWKKPRLFFK